MRRGVLVAAVVVLLACVALWLAATVERSPFARSNGNRRVPKVLTGRDEATLETRAAVRADDGAGSVRCRYAGEGSPGALIAVGDNILKSGPDLALRLPEGTWSLTWQPASGAAIPLGALTVTGGDVYTCHLSDGGWEIDGTVTTPAGAPLADVNVNVCGDLVATDGSGDFLGVSRTRTCAVRAIVRDGLLQRRSDTLTVSAFTGRDLALSVDDSPIAGMGIAFRMREGGARIANIHPGTPAEAAGLEAGDLIVRIDGQSTDGLTDDAFIALGTGREGSTVQLEYERDDELRSASFRRERLGAEDTGG